MYNTNIRAIESAVKSVIRTLARKSCSWVKPIGILPCMRNTAKDGRGFIDAGTSEFFLNI